MAEQPLEDLLARLERERREADRHYNDALTAVDRAIQAAPELPKPPPRYDDNRVAAINRVWNILPDGPPPVDRSIKGRVRGFVWRLLGPPLEAQRQFNAEIVDHINRNVATHRDTQESIARLIQAMHRELDALVTFESRLVQFLQTITAYVDTKDRSAGAGELHARLALTEQRVLGLKRELERLEREPRLPGPPSSTARGAPRGMDDAFGTTLDSLTYLGFEDRFRGSRDEIQARLQDYVVLFDTASDVLDVGCGRGELLDLLRERGIAARGVDSNAAMVQLCRSRGLDVEQSGALEYLERLGDSTIGGLVAIQVVEHFTPAYLLRFLETAHHKLRPGAPLVLETINPACWMAFFECFIRDVTHRWPLHPETLRYLVQTSGFSSVDVRFREPVREADRLERVSIEGPSGAAPSELSDLIETINAHADKLNARLFSAMDYAVVARR